MKKLIALNALFFCFALYPSQKLYAQDKALHKLFATKLLNSSFALGCNKSLEGVHCNRARAEVTDRSGITKQVSPVYGRLKAHEPTEGLDARAGGALARRTQVPLKVRCRDTLPFAPG